MEIYRVGGCVRDWLLGQNPKDIDYVVVGATAEDMFAKGFKQVGADFPVFLSEDGTEYALARTERKTGRGYSGFTVDASPDVTLADDLRRRDLTVNAMAILEDDFTKVVPEGYLDAVTILDPFNGQDDLEAKVLRHVSEAFADDPVRVLRLARFHARYGPEWKVAPETMAFCREMVTNGELGFLTPERVWAETWKALSEPYPELFFTVLRECGALEVVFPEFMKAGGVAINVNLRAYRSRSAAFNFAKVMELLSEDEQLLFAVRLRVPTGVYAYAKLFRQAIHLSETPMVERLYQMDLFRRDDIWEDVVEDATAAGADALVAPVNEAFNAVKHVSFETIPAHIREALKGPERAAAIKRQRVFAYETFRRRL